MPTGPKFYQGCPMNRSLPFLPVAAKIVIGAVVAISPMSSAHADLDSLLGDWADAAASNVDTDATDDVSLSPASATESLISQTPVEAQFTPADWNLETNQPKSADLLDTDRNSTGDSKETLTNSAGHSHSAIGHSVVQSPVPADLYQVATPTANPYVHGSGGCDQCGTPKCGCESRIVECDSGQCGGSGCGCSSCGQLVDRSSVHCIEGQSECRPHRRPNLPPPSTFLDLFRSRNSYTDVWAGYADETRLRVRNRSPHLDGTWRCRGCGALVERDNNACGCGCGR